MWRYTYDVWDQLASASRYASAGDAATAYQVQVTYRYDAFGRRVAREKRTPLVAEREEQHFLHDGWDIALIEERRPKPTVMTLSRRTWFTVAGTDDMVAMTDWDAATGLPKPGSHYYSTDHQGTVRALHDDAGNIVADLDHDSYGNPQATVQSVAQPYRFTGREYDKDTGLYQYRAREYDPVTGRFLQEDPIWFDSGDMNVYRYTWNNPVMWRDPSGMSPLIEYACLASFGSGAGATTGAAAGLGPGAIFTTISKVLAVITGNEDRLPEIDAQWNRAQTAVLATVAAIDAAGLACGRAKAKKQKPKSCRELSKPNSFSGETVVFTERGLRPIAELKIGDKVAAWNPATGKHDWKPITARSERTATSGLVRLTLKDASGHTESLSTTTNHPFLRAIDAANDNPPKATSTLVPMEPAGLWTAAGKLQPRDLIQAADGRSLTVAEVAPLDDLEAAGERVYSLEVDGLHSFAVGELEAWSHNNKAGPSGEYMRHFILCKCRKEAEERARKAGGGRTPIEHSRSADDLTFIQWARMAKRNQGRISNIRLGGANG